MPTRPLSSDLASLAPDNLPEHLHEHLPVAQAAAERNVAKAGAAVGARVHELDEQAYAAVRMPAALPVRITRLKFIAGQWSEALGAHAACRQGCSSCCHVAVSLSRAEARLIAQKTGARLNEGPGTPLGFADPKEVDRIAGTPCPFLADGLCSIYAHRPFVCRTLVNMDDSPVLCEIVPGVNVPVPYANSVNQRGLFAAATLKEPHADIREWFGAEPLGPTAPA